MSSLKTINNLEPRSCSKHYASTAEVVEAFQVLANYPYMSHASVVFVIMSQWWIVCKTLTFFDRDGGGGGGGGFFAIDPSFPCIDQLVVLDKFDAVGPSESSL